MMKTKVVTSPVVFLVTEMTVTEPFTYTKWEGMGRWRRKVTVTLPRGYLLNSVSGRGFYAPWVHRIRNKVVPSKVTWHKEITTMNEYTGEIISTKIERVLRPAELGVWPWPKNSKE